MKFQNVSNRRTHSTQYTVHTAHTVHTVHTVDLEALQVIGGDAPQSGVHVLNQNFCTWLRGAGEADLGGSWHHGIRAFMASQAHDTRCFLATRALSFASCYLAQSTCGSAWADGGPHRGACALPKSQMRVTGASLGREIHTQYSRKGTTWWKWHKNRGSNIIEYVTVFVNLVP